MSALLLLALLAGPAAAKAPRAPDFSVATVLGAPVAKVSGLKDLQGKVVYLEFWATWCPPCVAGIPRTNRLIDKLAGEPVVFLFVTDEPESKIRPWLAKREVKAWVGLDPEKKTLGPYKVKSRPAGYLIGKDGALLAKVHPESLDEKDVRAALAGTFAPRPVSWAEPKAEPPTKGPEPLLSVAVSTRAWEKGRGGSSRGGAGLLEFTGFPPQAVLSQLLGVSQAELVYEGPAGSVLDARFSGPASLDEAAVRAKLLDAVTTALGLEVAEETRELDAFVLSLSTAPGAPRPPAGDAELKGGFMSSGWDRLLGIVTMAEAAKGLSDTVDKPVLDETGLAGVYSLDLEWEGGSEKALAEALATVGLALTPARRPVRVRRVAPRTDLNP